MSKIGWGKPKIAISKIGTGSKWKMMQTPVQNSTTMNVDKGEKKEALIEGGEVEDVRYEKNKHALVMQVRVLKGRPLPIPHKDGTVEGEYVLALQPEDPNVPSGIVLQTAHVSAETGFSSEDGVTITYTFDALTPQATDTTEETQIVLGEVAITGSGDNITVTVKPFDTESGDLATQAKTVNPATGAIKTS